MASGQELNYLIEYRHGQLGCKRFFMYLLVLFGIVQSYMSRQDLYTLSLQYSEKVVYNRRSLILTLMQQYKSSREWVEREM